ncbi:MAG: hypothetical protein U1F77_02455 [Kiritimatiellia bacterium]
MKKALRLYTSGMTLCDHITGLKAKSSDPATAARPHTSADGKEPRSRPASDRRRVRMSSSGTAAMSRTENATAPASPIHRLTNRRMPPSTPAIMPPMWRNGSRTGMARPEATVMTGSKWKK